MFEANLESFVLIKSVRNFFNKNFTQPKRRRRPAILMDITRGVPINYGSVGVAYDCWVRCTAIKVNRMGKKNFRELLGYRLFVRNNYQAFPHVKSKMEACLNTLDAFYDGELSDTIKLYAACLFLEKFETERHHGLPINFDILESDVAEVKQIVSVSDVSWLQGETIINPILTVEGTRGIVKAEADILVNRTLFDVKTRRELRRVETLRQLIGYYILSLLAGPPLNIDKLGFYYARFNYLREWPIADLLSSEQVNNLKTFFEDKLGKSTRRVEGI